MSSRLLRDCDPKLAEIYTLGKAEYEDANAGYEVILTCTHRSEEEQQALYAIGRTQKGRIVTQLDGVEQKSKHNALPALAFDFAIVLHGKVLWNALDEFAEAAVFFKKFGGTWGGDWPKFKDYPHVEL